MGAVATGGVLMLLVAAVLEGVFRQTVVDTNQRMEIAAITFLFWTSLLRLRRPEGIVSASAALPFERVRRRERLLPTPEGVPLRIAVAEPGERIAAFIADIFLSFAGARRARSRGAPPVGRASAFG